MDSMSEAQRKFSNAIRLGTVAEVDAAKALCRVRSGDVSTDWIPWSTGMAGSTIIWSAPSVGEQVILLCPDGDTHGAVAVRGLYSDANTAPSGSPDLHLIRFPDGAFLQYDNAAHALQAILPGGGTARLQADGGITLVGPVTIEGDVTINGKTTASDDVIAGGISLMNHPHGGVQRGGAKTDPPQ